MMKHLKRTNEQTNKRILWLHSVSQFTDIDECTVGTHNCHVNANCINTRGSFVCTCKTGYEGNGVTCIGMAALSIKFIISGKER
jgi:hypothetical protein